jgi:hypothetical protein
MTRLRCATKPLTLAAMLCLCAVRPAFAEDLQLQDQAWNGLSELADLARAGAAHVASPARIDMAALTPHDALLIVHPRKPLPVAEIAGLLRGGGRVAIVDELGSGEQLLHAFAIERTSLQEAPGSQRLRDNRNLLIATAQSDHPLARGVAALVTNHTRILHHSDLLPVFALRGQRDAVVLAGAVGAGRLVAVSDASVLINNMLQLQGNRRFAQNLVKYLSSEQSGTLYLADSRTEIVGAFGDLGPDHPLRGLSAALARIAELPLPPLAVAAVSVGLALLLLVSAATVLPRRASYGRRFFLQAPECAAGFAGRVSYHARARNLGPAVLALKFELEHRLVARLGLTGQPRLRDVFDAMRRAGMPQDLLEDARRLLVELDSRLTPGTGAAARVGRRKFSDLVGSARRILAQLDALPRA